MDEDKLGRRVLPQGDGPLLHPGSGFLGARGKARLWRLFEFVVPLCLLVMALLLALPLLAAASQGGGRPGFSFQLAAVFALTVVLVHVVISTVSAVLKSRRGKRDAGASGGHPGAWRALAGRGYNNVHRGGEERGRKRPPPRVK